MRPAGNQKSSMPMTLFMQKHTAFVVLQAYQYCSCSSFVLLDNGYLETVTAM